MDLSDVLSGCRGWHGDESIKKSGGGEFKIHGLNYESQHLAEDKLLW